MGLLTEADEDDLTGEGRKLIAVYRDLDDDDKALVRRWAERPDSIKYTRDRLAAAGFHMGYRVVQVGLARLRESEWEC